MKISQYPEATSVNDADLFVIVQEGVTKKVPAEKVGVDDISGKADKVATSPDPSGYVAAFDAAGNLVVSTSIADDLVAVDDPEFLAKVSSEDFTTIVKCTQAEYDALSPADPDTLYIIVEA